MTAIKENDEGRSLEEFRDGMNAMLACYRRKGIDVVIKDKHHSALLIDFAVIFGPASMPKTLFNSIKSGLNSGDKNVMSDIGPGKQVFILELLCQSSNIQCPFRSDGACICTNTEQR